MLIFFHNIFYIGNIIDMQDLFGFLHTFISTVTFTLHLLQFKTCIEC